MSYVTDEDISLQELSNSDVDPFTQFRGDAIEMQFVKSGVPISVEGFGHLFLNMSNREVKMKSILSVMDEFVLFPVFDHL